MKKHFIRIFFETPDGDFGYTGFVTGLEVAGRVVIDPNKIFRHVTGRDMPPYTKFGIL